MIFMRRERFENGSFYHILNRGVDKRPVFCDKRDYIRFLKSINVFNRLESVDSLARYEYLERDLRPEAFQKASGRLVDVVAYCLMPNHYHILLKQNIENGISKFMQKVAMGYANYFNLKNNRTGSLFQGAYKSRHIESDHKLAYVSAYIHGNPEIHGIAKAECWTWSSYQDYLNQRAGTLPRKEAILDQFKSVQKYEEYVKMVIPGSRGVKEDVKKYLLE